MFRKVMCYYPCHSTNSMSIFPQLKQNLFFSVPTNAGYGNVLIAITLCAELMILPPLFSAFFLLLTSNCLPLNFFMSECVLKYLQFFSTSLIISLLMVVLLVPM